MRIAAVALAALMMFASGAQAAKPPKPAPAPLGPPPPAGPTEADWRIPDPRNLLVIDTNKGRIVVELAPEVAPQHAARILELTKAGIYNGRAFFRVIDNFMDQTGDPLDNGTGGSDKPNLAPEFAFRRGPDTPFVTVAKTGGQETGLVGSLPVMSQTMDLGIITADHKVRAYGLYCRGVAGMARSDDEASANSQFFLMRTNNASADRGTHALDQKYTVWGRVIFGQDVVDAIKAGEPPADPKDIMQTVRLAADIPEAERPHVRVLDARGAWFKVLVDRARAQKVVDLSACDIDIPAEVK